MADEWYETIYENRHDQINDFLRQKKATGRSPRTLNEYSRILKRFYHEHFPELDPGSTEVRHIEAYLIMLDERGVSRNTKRRYIESLSAFFSYAMKRPRFADITGNPAAVVLEEIPRHIQERPDCATWKNAKSIVHAVRQPRNKAVAVLLAKTGCRVTEALELRLDDLMLDDGFIRFGKRKGGKQTVFPLDEETLQTLHRFQMIRGDVDSEYLFLSVRGGWVTREQIRRSVRKAAVETGVMEPGEKRFHKKFTPHTFRTVFTTEMRKQRMQPYILRYLRGDAHAETMDIYTRVDREEAREEYLRCVQLLNL